MEQAIQPAGVIIGFLLCVFLLLLVGLYLLFPGRALLRRVADWVFNRHGVEKLGRPLRAHPRQTPYEKWLASARPVVPVFDCVAIDDVRTIELQPWTEHGPGVSGLYLRLADYQATDGRLLELPGGASTIRQRHLFEMSIYCLAGEGSTMLFEDGKEPLKIDWSERTVWSIPLNCAYQHVNAGELPVRLLAVTSFPFVLNAFNSPSFIENNPFHFQDRTAKSAGDGSGTETHSAHNHLFIRDALRAELIARPVRGEGVRNRYWTLNGNSMVNVNLSEMDAKNIKRAHRGNSDATVLMLSGQGVIVSWPDGAWYRRKRMEWREGTLVTFPIYWYRQFLNSGATPARNLSFTTSGLVRNLGVRFIDQMENDLPGIQKIWSASLRSEDIDQPPGR